MNPIAVGRGYSPVVDHFFDEDQIYISAKVKKIAFIVFAGLLLLGAVSLIGLGIFSILSPVTMVASLPLVCLAKKIYEYAVSITPYGNPKEVWELQQKAVDQDFVSIYLEHGLQMKRLLSKEMISEKFNNFMKYNPVDLIFSSKIDFYVLYKTEVISFDELGKFQWFQVRYDTVERIYQEDQSEESKNRYDRELGRLSAELNAFRIASAR